ncbi:hypothetical protein M1403_03785 [Patescibacteria group bacterium]|nr:hypothetical protein [Patescibacteria group bacterium]
MAKKDLAFIISRLLGPLPLLCLLWLAVAVKSGIGFWKALWVYTLIFVIGLAIPTLLSTYILLRKRGITIEWTRLKDRLILIPIYIPFWVIVLVLTWLLTNSTVFHLSLLMTVGIIAGIFCYAVLRFKISAHMMVASGAFWGVNFMTHSKYLWLFLLLIPLVWARLVLKQHTKEELIAGLIISNGIMATAVLLFGWPGVP